MSVCWIRSIVVWCVVCVSASPATLRRSQNDPTENDPQADRVFLRTIPYNRNVEMNQLLIKEENGRQRQVSRMFDSVKGLSEAGSVAHVLVLDVLDAVKDIAKTRCVHSRTYALESNIVRDSLNHNYGSSFLVLPGHKGDFTQP